MTASDETYKKIYYDTHSKFDKNLKTQNTKTNNPPTKPQ